MITKAFVTLIAVTNIDDQFGGFLPDDIIENADELNDSDKMIIGEDKNTFQKIFNRVKRSLNNEHLDDNQVNKYHFNDEASGND